MKTFSSSPPRFLKIFLFVGLSRAAQENSAPRIEKNYLFVGLSCASQEISAPRIEKNCLFGGQPAWKQESAQRETSVSATTHPPRNKRQRSGTSPRNKRQRSGPPGNKCRHNGTFCPEQHPSVIDTPDVHRPAARYSLGDMPYLRRKRRMK